MTSQLLHKSHQNPNKVRHSFITNDNNKNKNEARAEITTKSYLMKNHVKIETKKFSNITEIVQLHATVEFSQSK
jgi:hypothetical protein